jgi:hypothetical protein
MRDADLHELIACSGISHFLVKSDRRHAGVQVQKQKSPLDKMILKTMEDIFPVSVALVLIANRHLTNLCFGRRKRCGHDTSNQFSEIVKQTKMQLHSFQADIFIVEIQADRNTQYCIAEFAFLPKIVCSKFYLSECHFDFLLVSNSECRCKIAQRSVGLSLGNSSRISVMLMA